MIPTILHDGRRVQADECCDLETALYGPGNRPALGKHMTNWYLLCQCCGGSGEHHWSQSNHGVDPDGGHYGCEPCKETGEFKVEMP